MQRDQSGHGAGVEPEREVRTNDSAVSAPAVRTNVGRGRRALRAITAAMPTPTPTSEKTSVSCANPAIGMLAPVLSANETPTADGSRSSRGAAGPRRVAVDDVDAEPARGRPGC
ncbi:MAG TPA: hypothetical protein VI248_28575 [Kineosporiaceae bacterium]